MHATETGASLMTGAPFSAASHAKRSALLRLAPVTAPATATCGSMGSLARFTERRPVLLMQSLMKCADVRLTVTRSWPMMPTCATSVQVGSSPFMAPTTVTGMG